MPLRVLFFTPATSAVSSTMQLKIFRVGRIVAWRVALRAAEWLW
jgi:hypothetical protein